MIVKILEYSHIFFFVIFALLISACEESTQPDTTPPTVSIQSPITNNPVFEIVNIEVSSSDNEGVQRIDFYIDDSLHFQDFDAPYIYDWNTTNYQDQSEHIVKAISYDDAENFTETQPIILTVDNSGSYPDNPFIYPILFQNQSFLVNWGMSIDLDFQSYSLYEGFLENMSDEVIINTAEAISDTTFEVINVELDEFRYYRVVTTDNVGLESFSEIQTGYATSNYIAYNMETGQESPPFSTQEIYLTDYLGISHYSLTEGLNPIWKPDGSGLYFVRKPYLFSIDINGSNLIQLTHDQYFDFDYNSHFQIELSNDGEFILFITHDGNDLEIGKVNTDGNGYITLTDNEYNDYNPQLSPDGTRLIYSSDRIENDGADTYDIYLADINGLSEINLTNNQSTMEACWSLDGTQIYFLKYLHLNQNCEIMKVNLDGTNLSHVAYVQSNYNYFLSLSPDGQYLYYHASGGYIGRCSIYGENNETINTNVEDFDGIEFNEDNMIVFHSGGSSSNLYLMNDNGTDLIQMTHFSNQYYDPITGIHNSASWPRFRP